MGNSCCRAESPCGSAEERSGLLKDDGKAAAPAGDTAGGGTCGPDGDDDIRKMPDEGNIKVKQAVQAKQSPGAAEPNNTQENGPLQKEAKQTASPSPSKLKENSTRAQGEDTKESPARGGKPELLQCTLNSVQKEQATADWELFTPTNEAPEEENPASVQDKLPDSGSVTAVCPEPQTETSPAGEQAELDPAQDEEDEEPGCNLTREDAAAEPSEVFSHNKEVISVPNPQLSAAAGQVSSVPAVAQKDKESPSRAAPQDPEDRRSSLCEDPGPEVVNSHDVCESPPGPEPTGLDHSGEERDAAKCVSEPETTAPTDASESSKSDQDAEPDPEGTNTPSSKKFTSSEIIKPDIGEETELKGHDKDGDVPKAAAEEDEEEDEEEETKEEEESAPVQTEAGRDEEVQEEKEEQLMTTEETREEEDAAGDELQNSEEDLYRGAEELSASLKNKPETTYLKVEDRCSLAAAVDVLSYSEREWKGNTAKSALIRKGYKEMSQSFGSVRRVRGDNYCALRATLFQVLSHSTQLPAWLQEQDINMLWKQLEAQEGLVSEWIFPGECLQRDGTGDATLQLKGYTELLRNKWQAAVDCSSAAERQQLCERTFQGGEEELGLLEALKLLMLGRAVELHSCMQAGGDVPLFCWLLFARDSSDCPRSFLSNHLSHVGLSAGLEQVEMFLLGYALQCTIQVYRLYKADTEEFVTFYPDDHKDDWPSVSLVTEDDRHYNVPVVEAAEELHKQLGSS